LLKDICWGNLTMQTVGTYLKSNRESKNISLSEIAHHTKISKLYLDCLEKDDFRNIPGGPYIKGYISSYAEFIGIDENEAIKKYDSSNQENKLTKQADIDIVKNSRLQPLAFISKKIRILSLVFIIIIPLLVGFYHFMFQDQENTKLDKSLKSPMKSESQSPKEQVIELPSEGSQIKKTNSDIQNTEPIKNLELAVNTLPEPIINQPAAEKISKSPVQLETSNIKTPPPNTDSMSQKGQLQPVAEDGIKVVKAVAGGGVQNKNPIDTGNTFQWSKGRVYIWSMINCKNPPVSIKHIYYFNEKKVSEVLLDVKSQRWRTWSYKTIPNKRYIGQWRVDITSADKVLKTIRFEIK
jgi:cytoskeletal protein RodZ